jgi:hypothetical protein
MTGYNPDGTEDGEFVSNQSPDWFELVLTSFADIMANVLYNMNTNLMYW